MPKLTGEQRLQIVIAWIKRGRDIPKEQYIKKVCELKGIEYVAPKKVNR